MEPPESKRPIPVASVTDWAAGPANCQLIVLPSWSRGGVGFDHRCPHLDVLRMRRREVDPSNASGLDWVK